MAEEKVAAAGTQPPVRLGFWARLWKRPESRWLLGIPLGGLLMLALGAIGLGTVNWVVHETSSTEFCLACHSHQLFIRPEYEASSHYRNEVGVRAGCADCHLTHDNWFKLMWTKIKVSTDVIGEASGEIGTQQKYNAHRGEMAQKVWRQMLADDSKFCRSCHSFQAMDLKAEPGSASHMHTKAIQQGKTCIECHQGIVHALPENQEQLWDQVLASVHRTK